MDRFFFIGIFSIHLRTIENLHVAKIYLSIILAIDQAKNPLFDEHFKMFSICLSPLSAKWNFCRDK
jgi:hypothetical protein